MREDLLQVATMVGVKENADILRQEQATRRLGAFTRRMFPKYQPAQHITDLQNRLEELEATPGDRLIVTMPPRHSKSLNVSEHFPAWYLGRNPDHRVIAASHSASLSYTFSRRVRNKIRNPQWPWPSVTLADDKGAVQAWDLQGTTGGYVSVGVGGSPTGEGGNLIIVDDPLRSQADAESQVVRDSIWEWFTGTLYPRLEPGGRIVLTATRWNEDDLTGRLLAAQGHGGEHWDHLHLPALHESGAALWPERWPAVDLQRIRQAVGSRVFEAQYQGRPVAAEGGMFKSHWWRTWQHLPLLERIEVTVDSAFKTGTANDYSAFAAWGLGRDGRAYLLNLWRDRVEFPNLIRMGYTTMHWVENRYPDVPCSLVVEDKASGQSAIQVWRTQQNGYAIPVVPYPLPPGESKVARVEGVTHFVEGGMAYIPEAAPWLDDWLLEHDAFPSGAHDDQVDTTAIALQRLLGGRGSGWGAGEMEEFADWLQGVGV